MKRLLSIITLFFILLAVMFCAGKGDRPDWILKGGNAFPEDPAIFGTGSAPLVSDMDVSRKRAATRAREEIGSVIAIKISSLAKEVQSQMSQNDNAVEETDYETGIRSEMLQELQGTPIHDAYIDEEKKTYYVIIRLSSDKIAAILEKGGGDTISPKVREAIRARKDAFMKELKEIGG